MKISAVLYAIVIAAFFMPFFMVSCQNTEILSVTGIKLITGGEAEFAMGEMLAQVAEAKDTPHENPKFSSQPMAIAAIVIAAIALILVLLLPSRMFYLPVILSVAGIACLFILKGGVLKALGSTDTGMPPGMDIAKFIAVKAKFGFWLANLGFLAGGVLAAVLGYKQSEPEPAYYTQNTSAYQHVSDVPLFEDEEAKPIPSEYKPGDENASRRVIDPYEEEEEET